MHSYISCRFQTQTIPLSDCICFLFVADDHGISIFQYPRMLHYLLEGQPPRGIFHQQLHQFHNGISFTESLLLLRNENEYKHTRLIRFLASKETVGVEGKFRSTFIILQKVKCIHYEAQALIQILINNIKQCTQHRHCGLK